MCQGWEDRKTEGDQRALTEYERRRVSVARRDVGQPNERGGLIDCSTLQR